MSKYQERLVVLRACSHSAARGETVMGDSPGGQLRPFWVQL